MSWCWLLLMFTVLLPAVSNAVQSQRATRQNCSCACDVSPAQCVPKDLADGFVEGTMRQFGETSLQLGQLQAKLSVVEGLIKQQADTNKQQADTNKQQADTNKQLTQTNKQLRDEFDTLQEEHSSLKNKYQKLENHQELLQHEHSALTTRFNTSIKDVAFHAYHSSDPFSVAAQGIIVYNTVTINIGDGYDKLSGVFTAPVSGTYSFFLNCMAVQNTQLLARIVVNGADLALCWSEMPAGQASEQATTQLIIRLNAGEKAWVDVPGNAKNARGSLLSPFMGFLIRAV